MKHTFCIAAFILAASVSTAVQAMDDQKTSASVPTAESRALFETIAQMDRTIFDALNAHDIEKLMSMFTDDLEFYQDDEGLKKYAEVREDFAKMFSNNPGIKRTLLKDSLEVYPIKDYGAIEIGTHRFCHTEDGKEDCGTFKFAMVWRKVGDAWKLSRVISYGH